MDNVRNSVSHGDINTISAGVSQQDDKIQEEKVGQGLLSTQIENLNETLEQYDFIDRRIHKSAAIY